MTNLHQLEHLLALDETRHFAKAAQKVHLSQPAFSRSIQSLEKQTGLLLFERKGGEIRPTPAGQFLIQRARILVLEAKSLKRDIGLYLQGEVGELVFGVGPFPAVTLAGRVIEKIRLAFPKVSVRIEIDNPANLLALLLKEEIDFFVADTGEINAAPYLNIQPLMRQYGHLYAHAKHPLAGKTHRFEDAWEYGIASVKLPDMLKAGLGQLLGQNSRNLLQLALECDDVNLLHQVALSTNTVVASTELAAKPWLDNGSLVKLEIIDFPPLFSNIAVVNLSSRLQSPAASYAIEDFRKYSTTGQQKSK
ncbi:LysR family transcriptional regulator [uncultured Limnobacter sp.]|uniref:LysR family transcriptional regulator n=1 Tax=uncultured Limnobacter sp. TaxID=199681 RepID=UPI0030F52229